MQWIYPEGEQRTWACLQLGRSRNINAKFDRIKCRLWTWKEKGFVNGPIRDPRLLRFEYIPFNRGVFDRNNGDFLHHEFTIEPEEQNLKNKRNEFHQPRLFYRAISSGFWTCTDLDGYHFEFKFVGCNVSNLIYVKYNFRVNSIFKKKNEKWRLAALVKENQSGTNSIQGIAKL